MCVVASIEARDHAIGKDISRREAHRLARRKLKEAVLEQRVREMAGQHVDCPANEDEEGEEWKNTSDDEINTSARRFDDRFHGLRAEC